MKIYPKLSLADGADFTAPFPKVSLDKSYADIFIGLGGAGVDVLAALKMQMSECFEADYRIETEPKYRNVRFLTVDMEDESEKYFSDAERLTLSKIDPGLLPKAMHTMPELSWMDLDKMPCPVNMSKNASGCRAYGRAMFMLRSASFFDKIRQIVCELYAQNPRVRMRFHIVSSLVGGTGSACLLDVCYLIRKALQISFPESTATLFGYLLLPDAFCCRLGIDSKVVLANGYAAMKELDYFMQVEENGGKCSVMYQYGLYVDWDRAPLDCCILFSGADAAGVAAPDGYITARKTAVNAAMHILTPSLSMNTAFVHGLPKYIEHRIHGACTNYILMKAAARTFPQGKILAYLTAGIFRLLDPILSPKAPDQLPPQFTGFVDTYLQENLKSAVEMVKPFEYSAADAKSMGIAPLFDAYENQFADQCAKINGTAKALGNQWDERLRELLTAMIYDPEYGPFAAASLFQGGVHSLAHRIDDRIVYLLAIETQLNQRIDQITEAIENQKAKLGRFRFGYHLRCLGDLLQERTAMRMQLQTVMAELALLPELRGRLSELADTFVMPLVNACETIKNTMQKNAVSLEFYMKCKGDRIVELSDPVLLMNGDVQKVDIREVYNLFIGKMLDCDLLNDAAVCDRFMEFAADIFCDAASLDLTRCLEVKYQTDQSAVLEDRLVKDLYAKLNEDAQLCGIAAGFERIAGYKCEVMDLPPENCAISSAGAVFKNSHAPQLQCRSTGMEHRISILRYQQIPLFALAIAEQAEQAYRDLSGWFAHISYKGSCGDFAALPELLPQSLADYEKHPKIYAAGREAADCIAFMQEKERMIQPFESDWYIDLPSKEELAELEKAMDALETEMCGFPNEERLRMEWYVLSDRMAALWFGTRVGRIRLAGADFRRGITSIAADRLVYSPVLFSAIRYTKTIFDRYESLKQRMEEAEYKVQLCNAYLTAVISGAISVKGLTVSAETENFGMTEKIVLSTPAMEFGRFPLYQGYVNFMKLEESTQAQIVERSHAMLTDDLVLSDTLRIWKDRSERMHVKERAENYPQKRDEILWFYRSLTRALIFFG